MKANVAFSYSYDHQSSIYLNEKERSYDTLTTVVMFTQPLIRSSLGCITMRMGSLIRPCLTSPTVDGCGDCTTIVNLLRRGTAYSIVLGDDDERGEDDECKGKVVKFHYTIFFLLCVKGLNSKTI